MASNALMGQASPSFDSKRIYPDPNYSDLIVVELLSRDLENYTAAPYGTAHPDTALFPNHRLVLQIEQAQDRIIRYYAADRIAQQTYNGNISYAEESSSHPIFSRDHIIQRSAYAVLTKLTPLTGLVDADVTAGGTGYDQSTVAVVLSGGTGSGGSVGAIVSNGVVIRLYVITPGTYTVAPSASITGGAGATGTVSIQPQGAVLVKEDFLTHTGDERIDGLYGVVRYIYETLPGPIITTEEKSGEFAAELVSTAAQKGAIGTFAPDTSAGVIDSVVRELNAVVEQRITKSVALGEGLFVVIPSWHNVNLPLLLFDIEHTVFCNDSAFATLVTNPITDAGSAVLRKHRTTLRWTAAKPDPDLSASSFATADIRYQGKIIQFSYGNVLNDALSFSGTFSYQSGMGACTWDEAYDFPATVPTATDFLAGAWYTKDYDVKQLGPALWFSVLIEYYSASGNPSIT